jgi:hypothetical protein
LLIVIAVAATRFLFRSPRPAHEPFRKALDDRIQISMSLRRTWRLENDKRRRQPAPGAEQSCTVSRNSCSTYFRRHNLPAPHPHIPRDAYPGTCNINALLSQPAQFCPPRISQSHPIPSRSHQNLEHDGMTPTNSSRSIRHCHCPGLPATVCFRCAKF